MLIETDQAEPEVAAAFQRAFKADPPWRLWIAFDHPPPEVAAKLWESIGGGDPISGAKRN